MPNTPLLQRLIEAFTPVRPGSGADEARAPIVPDRSEMPADPLSRRQFVGLAALGVGLTACEGTERILTAPASLDLSKKNPNTKVAVIGGGLAGLTCAYRLRQRGVVATVYEASTRLGGRCWTRRGEFADGQIVEAGGELIDQSHKEIRQLAQELGLKLTNVMQTKPKGADPDFFFDGSVYPYDDARRDLRQIWQQLHRDLVQAGYPTRYDRSTPRGRELDNTSLAQWIEETVPGGRQSRLGRLLETAYVIEYGAEAEVQSALNLIYLLGYLGPGQLRIFGPSNEKYHVAGGNDQIVSGLVQRLGDDIVTGAALTSVARTPAGAYVLTFDGSAPVTADHVVLALPFSTLRDVDYQNAEFGEVKRMAIEELEMGTNAKLNVQFGQRHWTSLGCGGDTFSDTGYQATWEVTRGQPGTAGILVNYTGAAVTLGQVGSAGALTQQFLQQIEPVLPGLLALHNGISTFDAWRPDTPWVKGSYSYWGVGDYTRFAGAEGERSGNCHFAGEHTSIDFQGYLNGAVESGERAAREILDTLRGKAAA